MATTTNYGWTTPDDTALVKDGAAAIRTLGTSVDTTTKNLNPSTTLGDIEYRSSTSNVNTRVGIGSSGQNLTVVAGVPSWAASATSVLTTTGDTLYASAANTLARLGIGSTSQVLTVAGGVPTWATPASGGMTLLNSGSTALSSTSTTFNITTTGYTYLQIFMTNVYATADNTITMRINGDTGSNYALCGITSGVSDNKLTSQTSYRITAGTGTSDQVLNNANASIQIFDPNSTSQMMISHQAMCGPSGDMRFNAANGNYDASAAVTSILFLHASGSFSSGNVYIYGVK